MKVSDSCKYGQLWLLSILITSSGDWEFAELGVTPRLVVVSLLGNMIPGNTATLVLFGYFFVNDSSHLFYYLFFPFTEC